MFKPIYDLHFIKTLNAMYNVPNATRDYYFHLKNIDHTLPENPLYHIPTSEESNAFSTIEEIRKRNASSDLAITFIIAASSIISGIGKLEA